MVQETKNISASDSSQTIIQRPVVSSEIKIEKNITNSRHTLVPLVERQLKEQTDVQPRVVIRPVKRVKTNQYPFTKEDSIKFTLSKQPKAGTDLDVNFSVKEKIRKLAVGEVDTVAIKRVEEPIIKFETTNESEGSNKSQNLSTTKLTRQKDEIKINPLGFNSNAIFFTVLFPAIILGYVKISSYKYFKETLLSFLFPSMATDANSPTNLSNRVPSYLLLFLFFLNSAIFVYQGAVVLPIPGLNQYGFLLILYSFLILLALVYVKHFILFLSGYIFNLQNVIKSYINQFETIYRVFAVLSLPFIIFIPFTAPIVASVLKKILIIIFCFLYLVQMARVIRDNFTSFFSLYYIILYLCALEIAPLILIYKVMFK